MTPLDRAVVARKLQSIAKYLSVLQTYSTLDLQTYLDNYNHQLAVERLLHLIVEATVDLNAHLLVCSGYSPPESYYASFIEAGRHGILSPELAQKLAPSAGLRNRLVHDYEGINPRIVFQAMNLALEQYRQYIHEIQAYLEDQNAP